MCSKRLRQQSKGDWVVSYRLHHGIPVELPADRGERFAIAMELIDEYGWSMTRASAALGFRSTELAVTA